MTPLALTAITNFILSSEVFYLAGMLFAAEKERYSALWFWALFLFLLGASSLVAGIYHAFFEPLEGTMWYETYRVTYCILGLLTASVLLTVTQQFIAPSLRIYFYIAAALQLVLFLTLVFTGGTYRVVIANYVPVILLLLAFTLLETRTDPWAWAMAAGIVLSLIASAVQALGVNRFLPLDYNGLYHIIMMVAVVFLYLGARALKPMV